MDEVTDLTEPGESDALFSLNATENAQVVQPTGRDQSEGLWTVTARPAPEEPDGSGAAQDTSRPTVPPPFGTAYRSPIGSSIRREQAEWIADDDLWVEATIEDDPVPSDEDRVPGGESGEWDPDPASWTTADSTSDGAAWSTSESPFAERPFAGGAADGPDPLDDFGAEAGADWASSASWAETSTGVHDSVGSVFRAEPVEHDDEIIDQPEEQVDVDPVIDPSRRSLFSSAEPTGSVFGSGTWTAGDPAEGAWRTVPSPESHTGGLWSHEAESEEESPGFHAAISRIDEFDRERAAVPLQIAGALLARGEEVLGALVGQMLGRPSVMVLTTTRVLVINNRRWQPVVDIYLLDGDLEVRGRHDRNVAAIGLSDSNGLSMIDGIYDVEAAMDMVARIRTIIEHAG